MASLSNKQRIFPLHLSPIEQFLLADDRPRYPMDFIVETGFQGIIDRFAFEASLAAALDRHPLLRCMIQPAKGGLPCWVLESSANPWTDWGDAERPIVLPGAEYIDLSKELGLRIWIRTGNDRTRIVWQFHHACTDGIGAYRFLGDLMAFYGQRVAADAAPPELAPIELESLKQRKYRVTGIAFRGRERELWSHSWRFARQTFMTTVQPLSKPIDFQTSNGPNFPGIELAAFDREEHDQIRAAAVSIGCTVNDLLLACLFQTASNWNQALGRWRFGKWFRIMMPTDMRNTCDYSTPAANLMSYTFLDRRVDQCQDALGLIRGIRDETALIKLERRGELFNDAVAGGSMLWKRIIPMLLSGEHCLATAVLSNVGDPTKRFTAKLPRSRGYCVVGNLLLDEFTGVPPMRPKTRVTISIASFLKKLTICMRCDVHSFSPQHTRELLGIFKRNLETLTKDATRGANRVAG